jgi:hypothetical protein
MGVLLPSARRKISTEVAGRRFSSLESVSIVKEGTLLSIEDGRREGGSTIDGSQCVKAIVQVTPGRVINVVGYGEDQIKAIKELAASGENAEFNAYLRPSPRNAFVAKQWFKLAEFIPKDAPTELTAA